MRNLIHTTFVASFDNSLLAPLEDQARVNLVDLTAAGDRLAFTTDSYVVDPIFFPGGDIGCLAVNGTVNDLAVSGATPLYLSCSVIIEEGLSIDVLREIADSMGEAARLAGVEIVTGDRNGKADTALSGRSASSWPSREPNMKNAIPSAMEITPRRKSPNLELSESDNRSSTSGVSS